MSKLKNLSSTVAVCLAILEPFGREGAYLTEVVTGWEELGLDSNERSVCAYLHRVVGYGYIKRTKGEGRRTIYKITPSGRKELKWWRDALGGK